MLDSGLAPSGFTLQWLIRMHVRRGDIDSALAVKADADNRSLALDAHSSGLLINSLTKRNMLVEALKLLEDCSDRKMLIPNSFVHLLRVRCAKLGIEHPNMPSDPNFWVKRVKADRQRTKTSPKRKLQGIQSKLFI
jgi:hypothetical protein